MNEPVFSEEFLRRYQQHIGKKYHYGVNIREIALVLDAQAELEAKRNVTQDMIDAVYNLRLREYAIEDTGCAINNAKAFIRRELETALEVMR